MWIANGGDLEIVGLRMRRRRERKVVGNHRLSAGCGERQRRGRRTGSRRC